MKRASLPAVIGISTLYLSIITGWWALRGADYREVSSHERVLSDLVAPLGLGAVFLVAVVTWLGWWRPVMSEPAAARPRWTALLVGAGMACFVAVNLIATDWTAIAPMHLVLLAAAGVLVGFNEEVLFRGVNVVGLRQRGMGEKGVWLATALLFAMAHLANGAFGTGLGGAIGQAVLTFFAASTYYLLRRVGGSLVVPIIFHALWDFSLFAQQASGAPAPVLLLFPLSMIISLLATGLVLLVLSRDATARQARAPHQSPALVSGDRA